eukprot:scaffold6418_cov120-Skeletonema_menzelii.AAC.1
MKDEELSSVDVELSNHRKQLNAYMNEMSTKDNELKKKHEELSDQISDNEQLRKRLDEMKCQVGQLSAQNAELVTRESNLKKINEDLSAEKSQLSAQVESLNERIKYSKAVDLVDLTTDVAADNSGESPHREGLPSKRRRRTSGDDVSPNQAADNEGNQNVDNITEAFQEALEKHKTDIFNLVREAASRGEKMVSEGAVVQTRMNNLAELKRARPLISNEEITAALSKAESDAHRAYVQSLRQHSQCDAPTVHRPH